MFDDILLFVEVVKNKSFYNLAKKINIAQSTISRRIQNLEDGLGIKLINRDPRHFHITEHGLILYEAFENSASEWQSRLNSIYKTKTIVKGKLNIVLPHAFSTTSISPYLGEFVRKYPEIQLKLVYQYAPVDLYKENLDIAITSFLPENNSVMTKPIYGSKVIMVASPKYRDRYGIPDTIEEIFNHQWISGMTETGSISRSKYLYKEGSDEKIEVPNDRFALYMNNFDHARMAILEGEVMGAQALDRVIKDLESGKLLRVLPDYHAGIESIYMSWVIDSNDLRFKAFSGFIDMCMSKLTCHVNIRNLENLPELYQK